MDLPLHELALDHHLGRDAGMVRAGLPEHVAAAHALEAAEDVLERVVEGVPHVERTRHVRRRDDDRVGLGRPADPARPGLEGLRLLPAGGDARLDGGGIERLVHHGRNRQVGAGARERARLQTGALRASQCEESVSAARKPNETFRRDQASAPFDICTLPKPASARGCCFNIGRTENRAGSARLKATRFSASRDIRSISAADQPLDERRQVLVQPGLEHRPQHLAARGPRASAGCRRAPSSRAPEGARGRRVARRWRAARPARSRGRSSRTGTGAGRAAVRHRARHRAGGARRVRLLPVAEAGRPRASGRVSGTARASA